MLVHTHMHIQNTHSMYACMYVIELHLRKELQLHLYVHLHMTCLSARYLLISIAQDTIVDIFWVTPDESQKQRVMCARPPTHPPTHNMLTHPPTHNVLTHRPAHNVQVLRTQTDSMRTRNPTSLPGSPGMPADSRAQSWIAQRTEYSCH